MLPIYAIIVDNSPESCKDLVEKTNLYFPNIKFIGIGQTKNEYVTLFKDFRTDIVFIDPKVIPEREIKEIRRIARGKVFICLSDSCIFSEVSSFWHSVAYLLKPILVDKLCIAIESAINLIKKEQEKKKNEELLRLILRDKKNSELIGIPTVGGYQILMVKQIIRCEGLNKCTRIITTIEKKSIVSSYNIGGFKGLLSKYENFFSPHRSHLINVLCVKQFKKSGQIIMSDNASVPIAKNKKEAFLSMISHL